MKKRTFSSNCTEKTWKKIHLSPFTTTYKYDQLETKADGTSAKSGNTQNIVTDALGRTSVTTYNITMQVISVSDQGLAKDAENSTEKTDITQTYSYDAKGRTSVVTDGAGNTSSYTYDGKDRVSTVVYKSKDGSQVLQTCYTYDKSDQVTSMTDYTGSGDSAKIYRYTEFKYDSLKRMTELVEVNTSTAVTAEVKAANTTKYSYDVDGNLLSVTYPESDWNVKGLVYTYNTDKWLTAVSAVVKVGTEEQTVVLRTYEYDAYGDVSVIKDYRVLSDTGEVVENPVYTACTFTYDIYRRPVTMTYADSTNLEVIKEAYTYQYDKNSRLTRVTLQNLYPEEADDQQDEIRTYVYDARGNLLRSSVEDRLHAEDSYQTSYTYDAVGNRLTETKSTLSGVKVQETGYTYNDLNQLINSVTRKADETITASKTYTYDGAGNQIKETEIVSGTEITTTYDPLNRLASYVKKENGTVTLNQTNLYNGSGARIQKKESVTEEGVTTETINRYFYSQGSVLYTEDGSGKGTSLNLLGIAGNVIATARETEGTESYYYYQKDPAGSVTNVRDASGGTVVSYQYTDFGETSIYGDTDFYNEICYTEAIYDASTGLYYLSARYYDPEDGRFLTRDTYRGTATNPMTWHLYAYCANNPINYEDPSGHIALSRIIGGIVGAVAGAAIGSKIAKTTKATGLKKAAIIAGCTLVGGAVGALAGTVVKNVAKKAFSRVDKLPSVEKNLKSSKSTVRKVNNGAKKKNSNTKSAIGCIVKKEVALESVRGGTTSALQSGATGGDMKQAAIEGAISGAAYGVLGMVTNGRKAIEVGINLGAGLYSGYKSARAEGKTVSHSISSGMLLGAQQGLLSAVNWDKNLVGNDWITKSAKWVTNRVADVYGISTGIVVDIACSQ